MNGKGHLLYKRTKVFYITGLPTTRFMGVDDDNKLHRCVANGNNTSQYSLNMIDRFVKDLTNKFTSFRRQKDSETRSTF